MSVNISTNWHEVADFVELYAEWYARNAREPTDGEVEMLVRTVRLMRTFVQASASVH